MPSSTSVAINLGLRLHRWIFSIDNDRMILQSYELQERETKRHKFKVTAAYRAVNWGQYCKNRLKLEQVPMNETVRKMAIENFTAKVTFCASHYGNDIEDNDIEVN